MKCLKCNKELTVYDIGFFKKMINRGAVEYECISCLAEYFGFTEEKAWKLIEKFQKTGCTLFPEL